MVRDTKKDIGKNVESAQLLLQASLRLDPDYGMIGIIFKWGSFELTEDPTVVGSLPTKETTAKMLRAVADNLEKEE